MAETIIDWADLEQGDGLLHCAQIALDLANEANAFDPNNADESRRAQERFIVLLNSVQGYVREVRDILETAVEIGRANAEAQTIGTVVNPAEIRPALQ